jgi:DNA-binding NtrC family response regulator
MVQHFLKEASERYSVSLKQLSPEAMRGCVEQPWKGNVRSLRAAIEQAVILSSAPEITPSDLFSEADENGALQPESTRAHETARVKSTLASSAVNQAAANGELPKFREAKERFVGDWERDYFIRALRLTGGNISRAAERAGMYRQSFQQKMRELEISVADLGLTEDEE